MCINLDTGSVQVPRYQNHNHGLGKSFVGMVTEYNDTTPSETVVFPSTDRRLLLVEPNTMLVVTGYNLSDTSKVSFRKVLRSNGIPAQGTAGCCPSITIAHSVRLHSVELPCWVLDRCNPIFIIKTPGSYEIDVVSEYNDVVVKPPVSYENDVVGPYTDVYFKPPVSYENDVVGGYADVVVTAMAFPLQEVNDFAICNCNAGW